MLDTKYMLPHSRSHFSFNDLFRPASLNNFATKDPSIIQASSGESGTKPNNNVIKTASKPTFFVTSEQYNVITNECCSGRIIAPSTSTIFYDLDDIAKRHSFRSLTAIGHCSATNLMKVMRANVRHDVFPAKSNAVVQECATQIHPRLFPRDSIEVNAKKVKKKASKERVLSSEIILRDNDYEFDYYSKNRSHKQQKFWSYAKYRTEYTKPVIDEKKTKKKDKIKRTVDPCPCQLFSYACPCTGNKSLTELASKCPIQSNQITSTTNIVADEKKDGKSNSKTKKHKRDRLKDDKLTNTSVAKLIEAIVPKNDPPPEVPNKQENNTAPPEQTNDNNKKNNKHKPHKKAKKVFCPNCNEEVDVVISISTTEEEECVQYENSLLYRNKDVPSTAAYAYKTSPHNQKSKTMDDDICDHEPPCELLPICQILPNENNYVYNVNQKCSKKASVPKPAPRVIRITKACRHHPPCTVVPSCQRANVLKNNCEFIPPCLHHPRCVNLPLCVPFSKYLPYDEAPTKLADDNADSSECPHVPRCKYIPVCQYDSIANLDHHQVNMIPRMPNPCDFLKDYNNTPNFLVPPKTTCVCNTFSPCQISAAPCHGMCRSHKSCQFDCSNYNNDESSNDTVIFIRDVGCQFRTNSDSPKNSVKDYSPKNSLLQSKASSNSFEFVDGKQISNYYTNIHTMRYEDKFTDPISGVENSFSTVSITSIDSECPSHGRRAKEFSRRKHTASGFHPQAAYVAAYSSVKDDEVAKADQANNMTNRDLLDCNNSFSIKCQRCCIKDKYKKMFSVKRRRKSRHSNNLLKCYSKRHCVANHNIL